MRSKLSAIVVAVSIALIATACAPEIERDRAASSVDVWHELDGQQFRGGGHTLVEIAEDLPYYDDVESHLDSPTVDENGVHHYERDGVQYIHPVGQAQLALALLADWDLTGDRSSLDKAIANADGIIEATLSEDGPLWVSYDFDFPLHGETENTIHGPWWSAMAQGQMLSLFSRLAAETGESRWDAASDRVFESFLEIHADDNLPVNSPWAVFVDDEEWLWLEEYAGDVEPMRVLNGHVFAMYGLYDYWLLTGDERAEILFDGAAETVLEFVPQLRNPGEASWYGMRIQDNPIAQSESYHRIHINQLAMLGRMTDDDRFTTLSDLLRVDFY